jgi:hypothetical protein
MIRVTSDISVILIGFMKMLVPDRGSTSSFGSATLDLIGC